MLEVVAFAVLLAFWLLLSGVFTPFLMAAGVGSAVAVVLLLRRMDILGEESLPIALWKAVFLYWPWLVKEIIKSGWTVSRIILDPRLPVSPTMVRFSPLQLTPAGLATHANSITLTPGTITVEADATEFLVHALTREGAAGCVGSDMDRRVHAMEQRR